MRGLLRLLIVPLVASLSLLLASDASADPFGEGPPNQGWQADSSIHSYCFGVNFNQGLEFNASYAMGTSLDAATQMTDSFDSSCFAGTDVRWGDANLPGTTRGQYVCTNLSQGGICFAADVTLDPAEINIGPNDEEDQSKTACHEVGHSVGLQHGDNKSDCMINGEIPSPNQQWRSFSSHHIDDHINPTY